MEKFTSYSGIAVALMNDNIDTDQLIPKQFLKATDKAGFGKNLFFEWRYKTGTYEESPEFILNKKEYKNASFLISGDNFGSGSSREHAAWALADYGFKAIIAGSYSDIFYNNALKNGLLPITQNRAVLEELAGLEASQEVTIDLERQVILVADAVYPFEIDSTWKNKLINGLDDIAITLTYEQKIKEFEEKRATY